MKIVTAIDSFKGSLNTFQSGSAVSRAANAVFPEAVTDVCPLADGGEGTVDAIISANGGEIIKVKVHDPLYRIIDSSYGYVKKTKTAVIEMATASGITLVSEEERNPLNTTTYGVGELISDALSRGAERFIVGIGGSATNDGGVGMLQALGFEFYAKNGQAIPYGAQGLEFLSEIRTENADERLLNCEFLVACDVKNTLCGELGCSAVYGPQKGATPEMIKNMDAWLENYADLTKKLLPKSDKDFEGAGAAGGLGFALMSYFGARLTSGIELVIKETSLEEHIKDADIVVTGEGRLDSQSCMGKAPVGVAKLAKKYGKLVLAFSGCATDDAELCNEYGIDAFFPILRAPSTLSEAMDVRNAEKNLEATARQAFLLVKALTK